MKGRLNLTIEESLIERMKLYAEKQHTSLSELVEDYFEDVIKPKKRKTFIDVVKELGSHEIDAKADLKQLYYKDPKHGG